MHAGSLDSVPIYRMQKTEFDDKNQKSNINEKSKKVIHFRGEKCDNGSR